MTSNPYPIQIKKRILLSLVSGIVGIFIIFLIMAIFSLTIAIYTAIILSVLEIFEILWNLLYLNSIKYSLDSKNFTFRGGVISRFEKVLPYSKIQHIIIYESFWQRILGISSVSVETARQSESDQNTYGPQNTIQVITGPFIPDLNTKESEKLKNYIISVSNTKYKPVAGV